MLWNSVMLFWVSSSFNYRAICRKTLA